MLRPIYMSLYLVVLLAVGGLLYPAKPVMAQGLFRADSGHYGRMRDFSIANGGSWEKFKRIRQGEATIDDERGNTKSVDEGIGTTSATQEPPAATKQSPPASAPPVATSRKRKETGTPARLKKSKRKGAGGSPDPKLITAPPQPTEKGSWWVFYAGKMSVKGNPWYDPHGIDFKWGYARKNPLPKDPRVVVHMHGSGGGQGSMLVFGPSEYADIEVRTQDAEGHNYDWREWWTFGADGQPYPGRRIAATLDFLRNRYRLDMSKRGIVLMGNSMGGTGAVIQTMILPEPWRSQIAFSSGRAGAILPRRIAMRDPGQYGTLPPDNKQNRALWDSIDFAIQAAVDPIVRSMHYRHSFSSDDIFSEGPEGSTQLEFVNIVEKHKIAGAFAWAKAGHGTHEPGVILPDMSMFEDKAQDVTLDRVHPAITNSTGNHPMRAVDRVDESKYPRGHYNMGIIWDHAGIKDDKTQIVFPLKYVSRSSMGGGLPDQPGRITVSVTPRRPRTFLIENGETLKWTWDNGALSGTAVVVGDAVTIDSIPLVSGENYKNLRIYR